MHRFKNYLIATLGLSLIILGISFSNMGHSLAQAFQNVRVINTTAQPIPVVAKIVNEPTNPVLAKVIGSGTRDAVKVSGLADDGSVVVVGTGNNRALGIQGHVTVDNMPAVNSNMMITGMSDKFAPAALFSNGAHKLIYPPWSFTCNVDATSGTWIHCTSITNISGINGVNAGLFPFSAPAWVNTSLLLAAQ